MDEDSNQEEKQNYLRENILEKGYDVNEFVSFLKSKKGDEGADIENWSMEDLVEVVKEFVEQNKTEKISKPQTITQSKTMAPQKTNDPPKITPRRILSTKEPDTNPTLNDEDYGIIIPEHLKCQKSETTELSKYENATITVGEPKKVDNGFFSKAYINFLITTNPLKTAVRRKHADFVWLRERLSVIFNLNVLPRLPKKGKVNEDKHIDKRMRNLERFLNYLLKDPVIKNSNILYDFLTIETDEELDKRKKLYNRMKTPVELKDIKTLDGRIKISVNSNKETYLENIKNNSAFNETCLKKFNKNFKVLKTEMDTTINRLLSFGPLFDKLIKISSTYLDNNVIIESYKQMKNIFTSCADMLKKQNSFFYEDVKEYLRLLSGNYHHIRDLTQIIDVQKSNYNKVQKSLISKKIELFRKGDTNNWQLDPKDKKKISEFFSNRIASYKKMCFKETNNVIHTKEKYGYHLNKIIFEYQRLRRINTIENKNKVFQFSKKQSQIATDYFKTMGEIIGIMDDCIEKDNPEEKDMEQMVVPPVEIKNDEEEEKKEQNEINAETNENKNEIIEDNNNVNNEDNKNVINEENKDTINEDKKEEKEEEKKDEEETKDEKKDDENKDKEEGNDESKEE